MEQCLGSDGALLYLTTRNKTDSYTAYRVLHGAAPKGGGFFVPFRLPQFTEQELCALKELTFSETVAKILNLFFGTNVGGWDIDFSVGRQAFQLVNMSHRIFVLESWHNHEGTHECTVKRLYRLLTGENKLTAVPGDWFYTSVDIAMLFGVFGQLLRNGIGQFHVALPAGNLKLLVALRYAQKMGLPVSTVALGADESEDLWEFIYHGNYSTRRDKLPLGLEILIFLAFGAEGVSKYLDIAKDKRVYRLSDDELAVFADGIYTSVVGKNRIRSIISNVKRSCNYRISEDAACAYSALQDCRVRGTGGQDAVLLSYYKPTED